MNYMHLDDKARFSQWLEENLKEKDASNTVNYRLLIDGKTVNMRIKTYHKEVYMQRTVLEGYIQNTSEIVWKAERSNQLKSAFLANMSHEIRTPPECDCRFLQSDGRDRGHGGKKAVYGDY